MWIDVHAHLYDLDDGALRTQLDEAQQASVDRIVNTAVDLATCSRVIEQSTQSPLLSYALGISPFEAETIVDGWQSRLRDIAQSSRPIAIGEVGLDDSNPRYPAVEKQIPLFEYQVGLAIESGLPLVVHSRGAEKRVVSLCRSMGIRRVLFHCFTGDREATEAVVDAGYWISLSGIVTFKNAAIREQIAAIPLGRLLVETDTPYLAPVPHRGKTNRPAWVREVASEVAKLAQVTEEELSRALRKNFEELFGA